MEDDLEATIDRVPLRNHSRMAEARSHLLKELQTFKFPAKTPGRLKSVGPIGETVVFGYGMVLYKGYKAFKANREWPEVYKALVRYGNTVVPKGWSYDAITLNHNMKAKKHKDKKNNGKSVIVGIGDYTGGDVRVWDAEDRNPKDYDVKNKPTIFNGNLLFHETQPFQGDRWTIIYFKSKKRGAISGVSMKGSSSHLLEGGIVKRPTLTSDKTYPDNYPADAVKILDTMSFGKGLQLVGSMSLRSQQYAGDYDGYEVVKKTGSIPTVLRELKTGFQTIIRNLQKLPNVFIGDIKCGVVPEWRVLDPKTHVQGNKVVGYDAEQSRDVVRGLLEADVITAAEGKEALDLLKTTLTPLEFLKAKDELKFHVVRWTPAEILADKTKLRDGKFISLEECIHSPGLAKIDVIGLIQNNRYTDFSVIYEFYAGKTALNPEPIDIPTSLKESILAYKAKGNYFKVLKRQFALAKFRNDGKTVARLTPILNSDLGRLYSITGDIGTLLALLDFPGVPVERVRFEIDQFINRLANIYTLRDVLKGEHRLIADIHALTKLPLTQMKAPLERLSERLDGYLQTNAKPYVEGTPASE